MLENGQLKNLYSRRDLAVYNLDPGILFQGFRENIQLVSIGKGTYRVRVGLRIEHSHSQHRSLAFTGSTAALPAGITSSSALISSLMHVL